MPICPRDVAVAIRMVGSLSARKGARWGIADSWPICPRDWIMVLRVSRSVSLSK